MINKVIRARPKPKDKATMRNIRVDDHCYMLFMHFGHISEGMHTITKWVQWRERIPSMSAEDAIRIYRIAKNHIEEYDNLSLKELKHILTLVGDIGGTPLNSLRQAESWSDEEFEALMLGVKMAIFMPDDNALYYMNVQQEV